MTSEPTDVCDSPKVEQGDRLASARAGYRRRRAFLMAENLVIGEEHFFAPVVCRRTPSHTNALPTQTFVADQRLGTGREVPLT